MSATARLSCLLLAALAALAGCQYAPRNRLSALETEYRALGEQSRAQLAQLENYKVHTRQLEQQLRDAEEQLALSSPRGRQRLASLRSERGVDLPPELRDRLVALSQRYPGLDFDPLTGISKLDTDILFDTGEAQVRDDSRRLLNELADAFQSPEAGELRLMVVGHTDDQPIAKRPTRERFPNNWHLSAARALAVADFLRTEGVDGDRLGIAGFGPSQPIVEASTADDRQRNRRVEIFILGPETPMVGWVEPDTRRY